MINQAEVKAGLVQPVSNTMTNKVVVIKFGGNALTAETGRAFSRVVAQLPALGFSPVVVHGGGPQISDMLAAAGVKSHFVDGLRYTDEKTLQIAEMVLSGQVNKMLVQCLGDHQAKAVGISGKDGKTLIAEKLTENDAGKPVDLGFVGQVKTVQTALLNTLIAADFIPVIAPLAYGEDGNTYNINADYAAAAIATALAAKNFVMMTNIAGLLDGDGKLIEQASSQAIYDLIEDGVIAGGMIPKTLSALGTLDKVGEVNIIDGRQTEDLLTLLSGARVGTRITR